MEKSKFILLRVLIACIVHTQVVGKQCFCINNMLIKEFRDRYDKNFGEGLLTASATPAIYGHV